MSNEYTVAIDTKSSILTKTGRRRKTATAIKPTIQDNGIYSGSGHHKLRTNSCGPTRIGVKSVTLATQVTWGNSQVNWKIKHNNIAIYCASKALTDDINTSKPNVKNRDSDERKGSYS